MDNPGLNKKLLVVEYPLGIRFWMQVQDKGFLVYECMGKVDYTDLYWFKRRNHQFLMVKSLDELNQKGFKPFLMNMEKLRKNYGPL